MAGQLAAKVRAKYPGAYDDLDDATLEAKVLAKYPEYADLAEPAPEPAAARTWTDTAVDLLPTAGGMAGGVIGGIGGTVAGMGVGGVPGAIGGATLGGAFGESVRQLANRLRGAEAPESALGAAASIGTQGAIQGASEAAGGAVTRGAAKGAQAVYRGYLKPSLAGNKIGKANQIVETALREGLPISRSGVQKSEQIIGELREEVDKIIAETPGAIDLKTVADRVRGFARQRYFKPGVDASDYQMALGVADKIDNHASLGLPPGARATRVDVPIEAANESKRALYTSITEAGFGAPGGAKRTTEKHAANQLKTSIENATGGPTGKVATLNARESKLIDAAKAIRLAVEREANQNQVYGVKSLAAVGTGLAVGGPAGAAAAVAGRGAIQTPVASRLALLANRFSKELGVGHASALRLANYVLSEGDDQGLGE